MEYKVFHGTPYDFDLFSEINKGKNTGHDIDGVGYHFSDSEKYAEQYSKLYVVENAELYKMMLGEYPTDYVPFEPYMITSIINIENPMFVKISKDINKRNIKYAKNNGYDAIIAENKGNHIMGKEFMVFDSNQIKIIKKEKLLNLKNIQKKFNSLKNG